MSSTQREIYLQFYRNMVMSMDEWIDIPMEELQKMDVEHRRLMATKLEELNLKTYDQKLIKAKEALTLTEDEQPTAVQANSSA